MRSGGDSDWGQGRQGQYNSCCLLPVVWLVSNHLVLFHMMVLLINLFILPFLSLRSRHIQEYFDNKRSRKRKFIEPQQEKERCKNKRKQMRVKA